MKYVVISDSEVKFYNLFSEILHKYHITAIQLQSLLSTHNLKNGKRFYRVNEFSNKKYLVIKGDEYMHLTMLEIFGLTGISRDKFCECLVTGAEYKGFVFDEDN